MKLHVNLLKYNRGGQNLSLGRLQHYKVIQRNGTHVEDLYQRRTTTDVSYAQAINRKYDGCQYTRRVPIGLLSDSNPWKGQNLRIPVSNEDWLQKSLVGWLNHLEKVTNLQEVFLLEGYNSICIKYVGGNQVCLTGQESEDTEALIFGGGEMQGDIFESVQKWKPQLIPGHRMVWVRIKGLPLNTWGELYYMKIGQNMGCMVSSA